MNLDFEQIRRDANAYANIEWDCTVALERDDGDPCIATYVMVDEEGEEVERLDVTDMGTFNGRQLMGVTDSEGEYLIEAFGTILAKVMYG